MSLGPRDEETCTEEGGIDEEGIIAKTHREDKEAIKEAAVEEFKERMGDGSKDPWKHRSSGMKCSSCMWFVEKTSRPAQVLTGQPSFGRCRRHAPTMQGYPAVFGSDWCGDHKLDENKR